MISRSTDQCDKASALQRRARQNRIGACGIDFNAKLFNIYIQMMPNGVFCTKQQGMALTRQFSTRTAMENHQLLLWSRAGTIYLEDMQTSRGPHVSNFLHSNFDFIAFAAVRGSLRGSFRGFILMQEILGTRGSNFKMELGRERVMWPQSKWT